MTAKVIHIHSRLPVTFSKRGKSCAQGAIGFGFRWLKNWCEIFKPISNSIACERLCSQATERKTKV